MILNSPTISGSLTVTGNIITSGSITLSGSIASASYAATASFVALAQSASNAVAAQTASFANAFTVAGTLTAQTLVVQTITSSVDFVTGSTRFGSSLSTSTHQFTGSVSITGSLAVVTTGTEFQVNSTGVNLGNALTDSHIISGSLRVNPNGLFVSGSGLVGIGTTSPEGVLTIQGTSAQPSTSGTTANSLLQLVGSLNNQLNIGSNTVAGDYGSYIQSSDNNLAVPYPLNLQPNGGNVGIGTSTPSQKLEVVGGEIKAGRIDSSNEGGQISFGRSTDNATAWYIDAYGNTASPQLRFVNVTNAVVAMTLTGSNVGIGTSTPSQKLHIVASSNPYIRIDDTSVNSEGGLIMQPTGYNTKGGLTLNFSNGEFKMFTGETGNGYFQTFYTNGLERMRITSAGNFNFNTAGSGAAYININQATSQDGGFIFLRNNVNRWQQAIDGSNNMVFYSYQIGNNAYKINLDGSATLYGALTQNASDRRLKNNITNIPNALDKIKTLNGVTFNWENNIFKTKRINDIGVIAQEVQSVLPEAVALAPFDIDSEGNSKSGENYLTVYYEKLIPLLIEGIKELKATNDDLQSQINELKAQ